MSPPTKPATRRSPRTAAASNPTVATICGVLEQIAPTRMAQSWDNVGLLAGNLSAHVGRLMLCIDLMPAVVTETIRKRCELVVAYHPPIFKPIDRLVAPSDKMEAGVLRCVSRGVAVYSPHTALDTAKGGANDVLARLSDVINPKPLQRDIVESGESKIVVQVAPELVNEVSHAMFRAGAGRGPEQTARSFRVPGSGTTQASSTVRGSYQKAPIERSNEYRIEMTCPRHALAQVVDAIHQAHRQQVPRFVVQPLARVEQLGIGRIGPLKQPISLLKLTRKLKRRTGASCVSIVGDPERTLRRAIIVVGAAGSLPFSTKLTRNDVIITGEIRHHDALQIQRVGCSAIALSHWSSERPALAALAVKLKTSLPNVRVLLSERDSEPFTRV